MELRGLIDVSRQSRLEEKYEALRCQFLLYKGNFERERKSCEELKKEVKMYQEKLENAEEDIKRLNSQLVANSEREMQSVFRVNRLTTSVNNVRFIHPRHPVDELWRLE